MLYGIEKLEKWELAYIAGIIDGEGCISIAKSHSTMHLTPFVEVSMTNIECIRLLWTMTGMGKFDIRKRPAPRKTVYRWPVYKKLDIYLLLRAIHPYLVVKKEQAEVMLEFVARRLQDTPSDGRDIQLKEEIQKLNE